MRADLGHCPPWLSLTEYNIAADTNGCTGVVDSKEWEHKVIVKSNYRSTFVVRLGYALRYIFALIWLNGEAAVQTSSAYTRPVISNVSDRVAFLLLKQNFAVTACSVEYTVFLPAMRTIHIGHVAYLRQASYQCLPSTFLARKIRLLPVKSSRSPMLHRRAGAFPIGSSSVFRRVRRCSGSEFREYQRSLLFANKNGGRACLIDARAYSPLDDTASQKITTTRIVAIAEIRVTVCELSADEPALRCHDGSALILAVAF